MQENLHLVQDLALILISAGVTTLICRRLKQPLILGYLVAGFLVGPHFAFFPNVLEHTAVEQWSEIGIIFLLFALGLEFSFKKLMNVGSTALITAGTIFLSMFVCGMLLGRALQWTTMEGVFLGGMLSMSSTTIIIKAFDDLGLKKQYFTTMVFGTLVVEDLLAVMLMVVFTTLAVSRTFSGVEMFRSMLKLGFFLVIWFLVGIWLIPTLLRKMHKYLNEETLLILAVGLGFGMVILASYAGFSSALGAFVMGSILAETLEGEGITKMIKSVKDLFGAIFFVSVGMLVDPHILVQYWKPIVAITAVVVVGLTGFSTAGVLLAGQNLKTAVRCGFSFPQIGEFAFILASLGVSLGVVRGFIYPVIVAVSVVTTFTTPYFIRMADPATRFLEKHLPAKWQEKLNRYGSGLLSSGRQSDWKKLLKSYSLRVVLYSVLLVAIVMLCTKYLNPMLTRWMEPFGLSQLFLKWIRTITTLVIMSPFLYGLMVNRGSFQTQFTKLWSEGGYNRGALVALLLLRAFLGVAFTSSVFFAYFTFSYWALALIVLAILSFVYISRRYIRRFDRLEKQFMKNFNEKEARERAHEPLKASINTQLFGHDIHLANITVSPDSPYVGKMLKDVPFRSQYGVNIVQIRRGRHSLNLPSSEDYIYPYDELQAIGTDEQIAAFTSVMEVPPADTEAVQPEKEVVIDYVTLYPGHPWIQRQLFYAGIREFNLLVVGIERASHSIMNPGSDFRFQAWDKVWLAGERAHLKQYKASLS